MVFAGHQEGGLDVRPHAVVHAGHLELEIEIRHGAQAADNDSANGTIVRGSDCATYQATGQGWKLDPGGLVLSRIDGGANGKCLDAITGAAGAAVVMWDCHGGANQRWHVDGSRLVNDVAGQCLQAPATVDDPLRLAACDSSSAQRWTLPLQ